MTDAEGLRLRGFTPLDGWALVQQGEAWWLFQPPYRPRDRHLLSEPELMRLQRDGDFPARNDAFAEWGSLARVLVREREQAIAAAFPASAADAARRILLRTTAERAAGHLDVVEGWLDAGRRTEAERALGALLLAPAVQRDEVLVRRCALLLERAQELHPSCGNSASANERYPVRDERGLSVLSAKIAAQSSLLPFAA